jgi:hypothetical protein
MHVAQRRRRITGTGGKDETPVLGILERDGKVKTMVIADRKKRTIQGKVTEHIKAGSALYSDELSYDGLASKYAHQVIDHAVEYVNGKSHNGMENFWPLLVGKRIMYKDLSGRTFDASAALN